MGTGERLTFQKGCSITPQLRSRALLEEQGYLTATVESRKRFPAKKVPCRSCGAQPMVDIKQDLFGCFDLLCVHPQKRETLYVQVTSHTNHATRRNKILASMEAKLVLLAGGRIAVHSWKLDDGINRWIVREEEITLKDFRQAFAYPDTVTQLLEIRRKAKKPDYPADATLFAAASP